MNEEGKWQKPNQSDTTVIFINGQPCDKDGKPYPARPNRREKANQGEMAPTFSTEIIPPGIEENPPRKLVTWENVNGASSIGESTPVPQIVPRVTNDNIEVLKDAAEKGVKYQYLATKVIRALGKKHNT